jgi:raffinose/stachyose/melibiose transport system permease protein
MNQKKIGGTKKKVTDALAMLLMIIVFCAFMFPFVMVIINVISSRARSPGCLRSKVFRLTTL